MLGSTLYKRGKRGLVSRKNSSDLEAVGNFLALTLRKTQLAIQNILWQKDYLDVIVAKRIIEGENVEALAINLLISIKFNQQQIFEGKNLNSKKKIISIINTILKSTTNVVTL